MLFKLREGMTVLVVSRYSELASGLNFFFFTINKNKATTEIPNLKNLFKLYIWKTNGKQFLKQKKRIMNLSIPRKSFPFSCLNHLINLNNLETKLEREQQERQIPSVGHWDSSDSSPCKIAEPWLVSMTTTSTQPWLMVQEMAIKAMWFKFSWWTLIFC